MASNPFTPAAPPLQSPLAMYMQAMQLKGMQQEQQINQLGIQQAQMRLQDQAELSRAWHDSGGSLAEYQNNLLSPNYNISPAGRQQSLSTIFQTRQEAYKLQGEQFDFAHKQATALNEAYDELENLKPEQRPAAYQRKLGELQSEGVDISHLPPQYDEQAFQQFAVPLKTTQQVLDERAKQADAYKATEQGNLAAAETAQKQPFDPQKVAQLNLGMEQGWQVLHPGQPLPEAYRLGPNATQADFQRLDSLMKNEQQSAATKAQRDTANAMRQQSFQLAQENAQDRRDQRNKPTADEQRRADLATNMNENLDALAEIAQRRPDLFGPVAGRWAGFKQWVGTSDPDIARLHAIHEYLGMASVGAHAMRNAQHVAAAADAVVNGFHNSPQAVLSAIGQAKQSLSTFQQDVVNARTPGGRSGGTQQPSGKNYWDQFPVHQ